MADVTGNDFRKPMRPSISWLNSSASDAMVGRPPATALKRFCKIVPPTETPMACPRDRLKEKKEAAGPASSGRPAAWMATGTVVKSTPVDMPMGMLRRIQPKMDVYWSRRLNNTKPKTVTAHPKRIKVRYSPVLVARRPAMIPAAVQHVSYKLAACYSTIIESILTKYCDALWHSRQSSADSPIELDSLVVNDQKVK